MRIKKVSQTSGYVGTVSNSYSGSTTDTYSCNYVNDALSGDLVVDSIKTKNMFDGIMEQGSYAYADGSKSPSSNYVRSTNKISVEAGKTYTLSYTSSIANNSGFVFFNNGTYVSSQNSGTTVTIPSGANQVVFNLGAWPNNITPSDVSNIQFEEGDTATTYKPYQNLNGAEYYSTSETKIGTWTDGKTLYRRVLTGTTPNSASGSVNFSINIDTLIFDDMYVLSDSNYFTKRGYYENGAITLSYIINKSMSVYFSNIGSSIRNKPFTLIVEYTK